MKLDHNCAAPVPFIDIEKAMSKSVNLMLSVLHGSKILNTFSTTRCDELLQDSQSNPFQTGKTYFGKTFLIS